MPGWETLRSRVVYANAWLSVREDDVRRPDGSTGVYGVVDTHTPAVYVVALTEADEVVLVTQARYPTAEVSVECPAGATDGEAPEAAARRELQEETGLQAASWTALGTLRSMNGICSEHQHVFLARGLTRAAPGPSAPEEGIGEVRAVPWEAALAMVRDGSIVDGQTASSLLLAALALGRI